MLLFLAYSAASAQNTYFIDGYHGGIWGHYPDWNTRFMVDMLQKHPYWKINVELEPETWDHASVVDPAAYAEFKSMVSDANASKIEYVNPAYAQSYMYNIDGESIIRQFSYGIKKLTEHFPGITFSSYSSEEPCFTSALPQILTSFGIKYASLKNPNTCFGGYTAAHGGELVNWQGPDGTKILTIPRYAVEALQPKSTWQTIAWNNSPEYINAAFKAGIRVPVGMTLQDAGWKGGPFVGGGDAPREKNQYTTWREYFNLVKNDPQPVWKVSQEDIKVSLVWGSQVMQRIAQQVRRTENKLLGTEKLLALTYLTSVKTAWPQAALDTAWRTLLLSQHHDCWIVPYNGSPGNTWANKVVYWTNKSKAIADSLIQNISPQQTNNQNNTKNKNVVTVFNTQIQARNEPVMISLPAKSESSEFMLTDNNGKHFPTQLVKDSLGQTKILFNAEVPAFGYKQFYVDKNSITSKTGAQITKLSNGNYQLETALYKLLIDPKKGGTISSLYAKKLRKEFVDQHNPLKFGGLRGNFYHDGGFKATWEAPAAIKIVENGPLQVKLEIRGKINQTDFIETITAGNEQPIIDFDLLIDWKQNVGIGEDTPKGTYKLTNCHKAFYDDSKKLLALFPLNLSNQKVAVNAPFDVTESKLKNTFFSSWDSIKNNIVLNWVDVSDAKSAYGMALFTDHTTNYTHGEDFPLGLDVQFSGMGLWGRDHTLSGPTHLHYAIMPHAGNWNQGDVWAASARWNEPMIALADVSNQLKSSASIIASKTTGLTLTSAQIKDEDLIVRVLNTGNDVNQSISLNLDFDRAALIDLNGKEIRQIHDASFTGKNKLLKLSVPKFGFRTIRLTHAISN